MPIIDKPQYSFNAGEISPLVWSRVDQDKYEAGLKSCVNAVVLPQGPVVRRPGWVYLGETKDSSKLSRLIPFQFSETQAYIIEMGDQYARFWMDGGIIVSPDSYTVFLCHFDGKNASNEFTDDGVNEHTIYPYGTAKKTTDDKVFGTASLILDGDSSYLAIEDHADFNFGAGDFCIDTWFAYADADSAFMIYSQVDSASDGDLVAIWIDTNEQRAYLLVSDGDTILESMHWDLSISPNTWYHFALTKGTIADLSATGFAAYINGVMIGSPQTTSVTMPDHDKNPEIGDINLASGYVFIYDAQGDYLVSASSGTAITGSEYKFGKSCIDLSSGADYLSLPYNVDFQWQSQTYATISFFVKFSSTASRGGFFCHGPDASNYIQFFNDATYGIMLEEKEAAAVTLEIHAPQITDTASWHHVCIVKNAANLGIYIDGDLKGYVADSSFGVFSSSSFEFGRDQGPYYLSGYLEDIILTHTNLFGVNPGDFLKDEGINEHYLWSYVGLETALDHCYADYSTKKFGLSSIYFDGENKYLRCADSADWDIYTYTDYVIEAFVSVHDLSTTRGIIEHRTDDDNKWQLYVDATGEVYFRVRVATTWVLACSTTGAGIAADDAWHHIALVKKSTYYGIFVDGVLRGMTNDASSYNFAGVLRVGQVRSGTGTQLSMYGRLDSLRISDNDRYSQDAPNWVVGTSTLNVPTSELSSDANTLLLMNFNCPQVSVPTSVIDVDVDPVIFAVRGRALSMNGHFDEFRVSKGAIRWDDDFTYPTSQYPGAQGGVTYEITTPPWGESDLESLRWAQDADIIYICNPDFNVYKMTRSDHDSWTCEEVDWNEPPWKSNADSNPDGITITPSGTTGDITLTASSPLFGDLWIGAYISQNSGFYRITSVTDSVTAAATVKSDLSAATGTTDWLLSAWNNIDGWPRCMTFFQGRLVLAGAGGEPLAIRLSEVGNYENMKVGTADDDPLSYTISSQEQNAILWMVAGKFLYVGTASAEYLVGGSSTGGTITPTSIIVERQSSTGSADHQPVSIVSAIVYIQRNGEVINGWEYNYTSEVYEPTDISILAEHLSSSDATYKELLYAQSPHKIVWLRRSDGVLIGVTIMKEQKVLGWHQHSTDGVIESIATIPGNSQGKQQDEVWAIIRRTINGSTLRNMEMMDIYYDGDGIEYHRYMDSCLTYSGTPTTSFSGADHLEGESVIVNADGVYITGITISGGSFTIPLPSSEVTVGLAYNTDVALLNPELSSVTQGEPSAFHEKRYVSLLASLYETCQLSVGPNAASLIDLWDAKGLSDNVLYTEKVDIDFEGDYGYDIDCLFRASSCFGFTLLGLTERIDTEAEK